MATVSTDIDRRSGARSRRIGRGRASSSTRTPGARVAQRARRRATLTLLGLWGDDGRGPHGAARRSAGEIAVVDASTARTARFPRSARLHPPAIRLERAIRDLYGLEPDRRAGPRGPGSTTALGACAHPLGAATPTRRRCARALRVPAGRRRSLHQIPVGPVHAGIIEPGHFRFTANGETVVRLEERLGYVHKGIDGLMRGATHRRRRRSSPAAPPATARSPMRSPSPAPSRRRSASTPPPRADYLRALMAELERLANHFGDIGAICNDASFALMHAQCGILRERVLRAADACFGHRLMMDRVVPGGVAADLAAGRRRAAARAARRDRGDAFPSSSSSTTTPPRCRTAPSTTGILQAGAGAAIRRRRLCRPRLGPRLRCAPRRPAIRPTTRCDFEVPVLEDGDVDARVWIRIREVEQSLALIEQILDRLPDGADRAPTADRRRGARRAWRWSRLSAATCWSGCGSTATGAIARCHLRDPSWFQWPLLEAVIEGNIVADFPLCNKSFNCSYSGHDL